MGTHSIDLPSCRFYDVPHDLGAPISMAHPDLGRDYLIGRSLCHYHIVEKVGEGGMGQVYRGRDQHLARDVAIKVLPPGTLADENARRRFRKEARTLSQLNHPNIATIYDFDTCEGVDFLAMELVMGQGLDARLAAGPLPEKEIAQLGTQLAEALVAAHAVGVIHRDIKPANLKIAQDGRLKMLDFGLAKVVRPVTESSTTTSVAPSSGVAGSLPYMAPEQLCEEAVDARTDIYGAGTVLYEMAAGTRPFRETRGALLVDSILHRPPTLPSAINHSVSPQLEGVIHKCLQKDPQNRYATAADLLVDLRALQHSGSESLGHLHEFPGRRPRRFMLTAGIVLVLVAVLAAVPRVRQEFQKWLRISSVPSDKLVAVLPFTVTGGDQRAVPFSDGLSETLTAKLTELTLDPNLQVIPAREMRAQGVKALEDARNEFGVTMVVEGSMLWFKDELRINIALVDTRTRRQLRAQTLTVPASNPFAVQDQVVSAAIDMLDLNPAPEELRRLESHGTSIPTAYDFYLQARGYLQNYDKVENVRSAIQLFTQALQLDPNYASAYAGRGYAYWEMYDNSKDPQWVEASRNDCRQALKLSSHSPSAQICLGTIAKGTGHYQEAAADFEQAVQSDRTNDQAHLQLAETYELLGDPGKAEATYRRAIKLRPAYWAGYNWLGVFYYHRAQYKQAAEMFEQVLARAPDNVRGMFNLAATYIGLGRYSDAISLLQRSIAIYPEAMAYTNLGNAYFYLRQFQQAVPAYRQATQLDPQDALVWWNLGDGYYWAGQHSEAAAAYQQGISLAEDKLKINPRDVSLLGVLAICHAMRGEKKPALDSLQRGLRVTPGDPDLLFKAALIYNHFGETAKSLAWLKQSLAAGIESTTVRDTPDFEGLRGDPQFEQLLRDK